MARPFITPSRNEATFGPNGPAFTAKVQTIAPFLSADGQKLTPLSPPKEPVPPAPLQRNRKKLDFQNMARLSTLPSQNFSTFDQNVEGEVTIYLPHLPEDLELARETNYDNNGSNMVMPDGLHIYQYTSPLEIAFQFTLHAFDDLCPEGSKTLLDIAARLHCMALPSSNDPLSTSAKSPPITTNPDTIASQEAVQGQRGVFVDKSAINAFSTDDDRFKYPPACLLRLIQAGPRGLGVNCVGFVKSPSVVLHGPYLQAVDSATTFNLPSAATYKFTFVHNPSYTNLLGSGKFVNAYGPDILENFYNTAHLAALSQNRYSDVEKLTAERFSG